MSHDYMSWANYVMNNEMASVKLSLSFQKTAALPKPSVQVFLPQDVRPVIEGTFAEVTRTNEDLKLLPPA